MRVAVIGGGLAGISCAKELLKKRIDVTLFEKNGFLGGRAFSYFDSASGRMLDNGQHVILSSCKEAIAFFEDIGSIKNISFTDRATLIGENKILNLQTSRTIASIFATNYLTIEEKLSLVKALLKSRNRTKTGEADRNAMDYLKSLGISEKLTDKLLKPILTAALNENISISSTGVAKTVLKSALNTTIGVPTVDLGTLIHKPSLEYLVSRGCHLKEGVKRVIFSANGDVVGVYSNKFESFHAYIFCVTPNILSMIGLDNLSNRCLQSNPIAGVSIVLDSETDIMPPTYVDGKYFGWIFARGNIISAVSIPTENMPDMQSLLETALRIISKVINISKKNIVSKRIMLNHAATFSNSISAQLCKVQNTTGLKNVLLAGDWCQTDYPSTMEGAILSGRRAAEIICSN